MEQYEISNWQRIQKLLNEIYSRKKVLKNYLVSDTEAEGNFNGKIGTDVAFYGTWTGSSRQMKQADDKYAKERIKLIAAGKIFANFNIKNGVTNFARSAKQVPSTIVQVFSPRCGDNGHLTKEIEGVNQLQVFHAPDETAEEVLDKIFDTIAYSKAKATYNKVFSQPSLATRLADAGLETTENSFQYSNQNLDELFASIAQGQPVPLPHADEVEPEELYHCNLRKPDWAYNTKLTKLDAHFDGLKHDEKQKPTDHEIK